MCGITGFYSPRKNFSEQDLVKMTDAISHRGPDASGYFVDGSVGLGHRRLSIIDLSVTANQPMTSSDGRYVMVYNGEVYNYTEIADQLKKEFRSTFKTTSDTEVILEAFLHYGISFTKYLNGMFAIAIFDKEENEIYIVRDHIGIKPLYYFWDGNDFAFASELKSIKTLKSLSLQIDRSAVYQFMHMGFIAAPLSIYKSVFKLEAGSWLKLRNDKLTKEKYWSAGQQIKEKTITDKSEAQRQLSELVKSAVQYQIRSDVPFGVFLSGGIDSSIVAANAANLSSEKISTFSIGFEENKYNESKFASKIANYLGTNHNELIVSYNDALELSEGLLEVYDEPYADSSAIPTMLVSRLARKSVTVALSGDGGDELFLGYGAYQWAERLDNPLIKIFRKSIASLLKLSGSKFERHSGYFELSDTKLQYSHILSQEQYLFNLKELNNTLTPEFKNDSAFNKERFYRFYDEINHTSRKLTAAEKQSIFDLNYYLQDDLLTKVDRASMKYSLEARVPLLDYRIVEFALNLSPELKKHDGVSKYLLKEVLYQYVPKEMFDRPKQGFSIPLEKWLRNELFFLIEDNLSKEVIEKYNYVKVEEVEQLKKEFLSGKNYLYNRLWVLIVLHQWLIKNA